MADTVEIEVKKKLEDVTKKLLRREAALQFARTEEGKQLTAQIKNAEVRLRLEEKSLDTKDKISIVEAEIAEAQKELADSKEVEHDILVKREKEFDVRCSVKGGGLTGQAGAIIHGLARAIVLFEPDLKITLKKEKLTTRDSRAVERKKYGHKKARRSFQFSKR